MPTKAREKRPAATGTTTRGGRTSLAEAMKALEKAGTAQTRKTYARHGAREPMFGVSFADMKKFVSRIGVDHDLAVALWSTGNHDARVLAMKVADAARVTSAELDGWAAESPAKMCACYVAMLAAESAHGPAKAREWLASPDPRLRVAGWTVVGQLATHDVTSPDTWYAERLAQIEKSIKASPNDEREAMNRVVIAIGGRSAPLRKAAVAAAKRIGKVEVDYGDTECKTPDAVAYIEKMWERAAAKKAESPAAQERSREPMRTRC